MFSDQTVMLDFCLFGCVSCFHCSTSLMATSVYRVCISPLVLCVCSWPVIFFSHLLNPISPFSCNNWDAASHCRGDFLFGHGFLRYLLEMIRVRLDWKRLDGCRLGMDSPLWSCANPCCGTPLGLHDWWNPIGLVDSCERLASAAPFWWLGT